MNKTMKVNTSGSSLNCRTGAGTSFSISGKFANNTVVTATQSKAVGSVTWYNVNKDNTTGWCSGSYLKLVSDDSKTETKKTNTEEEISKSTKTGGGSTKKSKSTAKALASVLNSSTNQEAFLNCTTRMFGAPHQFIPSVDYRMKSDISLGRKYIENIMAEAPIVYITPGVPNYLPNTTAQERSAINSLFGSNAGSNAENKNMLDDILNDSNADLRYFDFTESYPEYMRYVNLLCRLCAVYMGIGDLKLDDTKYEFYNWQNYKWREDFDKKKVSKTFFETTKDQIISSATELTESLYGKYSYITFYVNANNSFQESASNSTKASMLEGYFEQGEEVAKELQFFTGATKTSMINDAMSGVSGAFSKLSSNSDNILSRSLSSVNQVVQGANMAFPEMWSDADFGKSFNISIDLVSPYGTKEAVYLNCMVPLMHLLAFALPRYSAANAYAAPFLMKIFSPGVSACEMSILEGLDIEKGSEGNWTVDHLPTKISCTLRVKELYSSLSMNKVTEYKKFFKNTSMIQFLAVTCGVDITRPSVLLKIETMMAAFLGRLDDIPSNIANDIIQSIRNLGGAFFKF